MNLLFKTAPECRTSCNLFLQSFTFGVSSQWRRQLVGTWARAPLAFENIFRYTLKQVFWFGLVHMPNSNSSLFVQPYSVWNYTITQL